MPTKPYRPCKQSGCAALVESGYCLKHAHLAPGKQYDANKRKTNATLAANARLRNSGQWHKQRDQHKQMEPLCRDPFGDHKGFPVAGQASHHILPLSTHPELAFVLSNLARVCSECHARLNEMERQGKDASGLFLTSATHNINLP